MTKLTKLLKSGRKVLTLDDLGVIWGQAKRSDTAQSARKYVQSGALRRIKRGVYALADQDISEVEIANKLVVPSYISGETVLAMHGLSFQFTGKIYSFAPYHKRIKLDSWEFVYRQIKPELLFNSLGMECSNGVFLATPERAICDLIYVSKGRYVFEGTKNIRWEELVKIAGIYGSRTVQTKVQELREQDTTPNTTPFCGKEATVKAVAR